MIYYPLSVLMMAGIREILVIATPDDVPKFRHLLGDGSQWGIELQFAEQERPEGIAQAFVIAETFIAKESVALILGDNLFYGERLQELLTSCCHLEKGAVIFGYEVKDPARYGVVDFDREGRVIDIIEKPLHPPSRFAVTGLYFYDSDVVSIAHSLSPSARGEYEITDVNRAYLMRGDLHLRRLDRGFAWLDTGTPSALQQAATYVQTLQERQGISIGCLEEVACQMGFISLGDVEKRLSSLGQGEYAAYLREWVTSRTSGAAVS
jgi:glucose-1-phosphate thymidylyltransferase